MEKENFKNTIEAEKRFQEGSMVKKGRFIGKIIKIEPGFVPHARGGLYTRYIIESESGKTRTYEVYDGEKIPFKSA